MRQAILHSVLRWLVIALILRVLTTILVNYPDYFPPQFDSLFLQGRETTFHGSYQVAFYVHILSSPIVLLNGLFLLSERGRRQFPSWHRRLGYLQVVVLLLFALPSSAVMATKSFGGLPAGLSFFLLASATATCTVVGVNHAIRRRYRQHRRWMLRCYVLICSAVALRLISGTAGWVGVPNPEVAYIVAAWCSWLLPWTGYEIIERIRIGGLSRDRKLAGP